MFVDVYMTPVSGIDVLKTVMATAPNTLVVLMTGNPSVASSIEAMQIGAWEYLSKPYSGTQLQLLLGRAAHTVSTRRESEGPTVIDNDGTMGGMLVGASPAFKRATDLAKRAAPTNAAVMIVGETGTGKEVVAQYIHQHSRRSRRRLVPINCAAIPEQLLESEMFGHRKGAFTGADREKMGLLELADGGTLFLDELSEMSMPLQAKMLRVLQDGIVRRVGSEQEDAVVDVRFVSATNRDPRESIRSKQLREDLYYRLNVVQIIIPPLRERRKTFRCWRTISCAPSGPAIAHRRKRFRSSARTLSTSWCLVHGVETSASSRISSSTSPSWRCRAQDPDPSPAARSGSRSQRRRATR